MRPDDARTEATPLDDKDLGEAVGGKIVFSDLIVSSVKGPSAPTAGEDLATAKPLG